VSSILEEYEDRYMPRQLCPKCALDMTAMTDGECASHRRFHEHMAAAPKSSPSQDRKPELDRNWQWESTQETRRQFAGWREV
jgi:hypothetical protein